MSSLSQSALIGVVADEARGARNHESLFKSALTNCLGKKVDLRQETNFEGEAGSWCRRFVADTKI
jgi:hypothetical protein